MISRFCGVRTGCLEGFMLSYSSDSFSWPSSPCCSRPNSHLPCWHKFLNILLESLSSGLFLLIRPNPLYYLQTVISPCNHCCAATRINQHMWTLINYGLFANGLCPCSTIPPSFSALHSACTASLLSSLWLCVKRALYYLIACIPAELT